MADREPILGGSSSSSKPQADALYHDESQSPRNVSLSMIFYYYFRIHMDRQCLSLCKYNTIVLQIVVHSQYYIHVDAISVGLGSL